MTATHEFTRTIQRRFGLSPLVTYSCSCKRFEITDTGDEAQRKWLRHELTAGAEVEA